MINKIFRAVANFESRPWVHTYILNRTTQAVVDALISALAFFLAHLLRFNGWPPPFEFKRMVLILPYVVLGRVLANFFLGIYRRVWRYASISDAMRLGASVSMISGILLVFRLCFAYHQTYLSVPIGITLIDSLIAGFGMLGVRLFRRLTYERSSVAKISPGDSPQRVLLVGAGDAGIMTVREISRRRDLGMQICGFVDDDNEKWSTLIHGITVLGPTSDLPALVRSHAIDQVIITVASAPRKTVRRILDLCEQAKVSVKIIPGLYEILGNRVTINELRSVGIEDLLGRDTVGPFSNFEACKSAYQGKRIMVTGAAGSIGSELCRQLTFFDPATIIMLDKDENAVFETDHQMRAAVKGRNIQVVPVVCSLRIEPILGKVFQIRQPEVLFHAAAYKHVPLMESNPSEAVLNNIVGTENLLNLSAQSGVERCIMVSTDKAVRPTSIMGATKRVAELMFQNQVVKNHGSCRYSCVRFGNVLGSRGSVVPIFREQIKNGGPVTVTHPDMIRYFMTVSEAAQLIIQAGVLGEKGEIYLLDMGEPVNVVDLAKDMIRLSGLVLGEDIDIVFTGIRPGEKLKEELLIAEEGAKATRYEKIFVAPPLEYDPERLEYWTNMLAQAAYQGGDNAIYALFSQMDIGFQACIGEDGLSLQVS